MAPHRPELAVMSPSALLSAAAAREHAPREAGPALALRYRTLWISDVHLGTRQAKAEELLAFLGACESERLYVVGDLIDGWRLSRAPRWPASHQAVLDELFRRARAGAEVVYVIGNHDDALRGAQRSFGPIRCEDELVHVSADARRWLVLHGDRFDRITGKRGLMTPVGDAAMLASSLADRAVNVLLRAGGGPRLPVGRALRSWMKRGPCRLERWIARLLEEAHRRAADGIVCGHFHEAELRAESGTVYANTGDWVHSRTALVERFDGSLELVEWRDGRVLVRASSPPASAQTAVRA